MWNTGAKGQRGKGTEGIDRGFAGFDGLFLPRRREGHEEKGKTTATKKAQRKGRLAEVQRGRKRISGVTEERVMKVVLETCA